MSPLRPLALLLLLLSALFGNIPPSGFTSDTQTQLDVFHSTIGRTNLLHTIKRPLGAVIALDYNRTGNTYAMPQSRWVLSRVSVTDGHRGDGVDTMKQAFVYEDGYYDRHEREFYGFETVRASDLDTVSLGDATLLSGRSSQ